jgi:hypothetical protein
MSLINPLMGLLRSGRRYEFVTAISISLLHHAALAIGIIVLALCESSARCARASNRVECWQLAAADWYRFKRRFRGGAMALAPRHDPALLDTYSRLLLDRGVEGLITVDTYSSSVAPAGNSYLGAPTRRTCHECRVDSQERCYSLNWGSRRRLIFARPCATGSAQGGQAAAAQAAPFGGTS